jgi:hypothetical protein
MDTVVQQPRSSVGVSTHSITQLHEIAETIYDDAIEHAHAMFPPIKRKEELEHLFNDREFICRFKCGLSSSVSRVLAEYDDRTSAIYIFEPCANPDIESGEFLPLDGTLNLLLVVKSPTAGMEAFIASLDRALTQQLRDLPTPMFATTPSILNVIPVTEYDIEHCRGFAALLSSVYAPPLKVWPAE